ncbi:hypothetical protein AB0F17_41735 [Nonomuraea sp. NPDC026600]
MIVPSVAEAGDAKVAHKEKRVAAAIANAIIAFLMVYQAISRSPARLY